MPRFSGAGGARSPCGGAALVFRKGAANIIPVLYWGTPPRRRRWMVTAAESMRGLAAYFHSLVHDSARGDRMTTARHRSFIASRLLGGLFALAVFPVYLAVLGRPSMISALAFVWFLSPIAVAVFLSRTGRLGAAHLVSAANLTGLVVFAAALTGGITSFLIAWMVVVPIEAALSGERRVVLAGLVLAALALAGLAAATFLGALPPAPPLVAPHPAALALLGSLSALVYAGGLAVSVQHVHWQSEAAIRQEQSRYRLLADNATDLITRHDAYGKVVFASPVAQSLLGRPAQSLLGEGLFERVHVADRPAYLAALNRCGVSGEPVSVEFRARVAREEDGSGDFVWLEMRCRPIGGFGEAGEAAGTDQIVAVTRDIMERKAHEAELLEACDAAESASRAKTQFLANMSHELRTPLNAIIGFSEIFTRELFGPPGDERYGEYARLIHESGDHLLAVVNEILDLSKIEAGRFTIVAEPFDAAALATSCCEIMRHQAEQKNIALECEAEAALPDLNADKRACKQMLLNLLSNAVKFTQEGGRVGVSLRRAGESIEIAVQDSGIGIAEQDLPKLGDPFVQAEASYSRNYEGTGLGLSVVKGLARLHEGSLDIASQPGRGTLVTIRLPVDGVEESAPERAPEPQRVTKLAVGG